MLMAFEEVERGVREMVRSVLQEKGIKHRSTERTIHTICYAQQPLASIQYPGPLRFQYMVNHGNPIVNAMAYGSTAVRPLITAIKDNWNVIFPLHPGWGGYYATSRVIIDVEEKNFEVASPHFDTLLAISTALATSLWLYSSF
jgi:hypothetical protein